MKNNYQFYAYIGVTSLFIIKYLPPPLYIAGAVILSIVLLGSTFWVKKEAKLIIPIAVSFSFVGISAAALKAIEVYFPEYKTYSAIFGWTMTVGSIIGLIFLFITAFKYSDEKYKKLLTGVLIFFILVAVAVIYVLIRFKGGVL